MLSNTIRSTEYTDYNFNVHMCPFTPWSAPRLSPGSTRRGETEGCCQQGRLLCDRKRAKNKRKKKASIRCHPTTTVGFKAGWGNRDTWGGDEEGEGAVEEGIIYLCSDSESLAKSQSRRVEIRKQREEAF